jgi:hypothetical protein
MFPYSADPATAKTLAAMYTPERIAQVQQRNLDREVVAARHAARRRGRAAPLASAGPGVPARHLQRPRSWVANLARRVAPSVRRHAPVEARNPVVPS